MLVVKGQYGWSMPCDNKKDQLCYWLQVGWAKGNEPQQGDRVYIEPTNWFMSCYSKQDGTIVPKLIIMEWKYAQRVEKAEDGTKYVAEDTFSNKPSIDISSDDLPFY